MSTRSRDVQMIIIDYICDDCNSGLMAISGNIVLTSEPPSYPHVCNNCGSQKNFTIKYPYTAYRELGE